MRAARRCTREECVSGAIHVGAKRMTRPARLRRTTPSGGSSCRLGPARSAVSRTSGEHRRSTARCGARSGWRTRGAMDGSRRAGRCRRHMTARSAAGLVSRVKTLRRTGRSSAVASARRSGIARRPGTRRRLGRHAESAMRLGRGRGLRGHARSVANGSSVSPAPVRSGIARAGVNAG